MDMDSDVGNLFKGSSMSEQIDALTSSVMDRRRAELEHVDQAQDTSVSEVAVESTSKVPQHILDVMDRAAKQNRELETTEVQENPFAGLDGILSHSIQEAAGGMCSVRSLKAIGSSHRAKKTDSTTALLQENAAGTSLPVTITPFEEPRRMNEAGQLVVIASENPQITRLGYHHRGTNKVLELWQLVEARPETGDCSYAVFMPYLDSSSNIDFSMVVSKDDEEKPHSSEGLLYEGKGLTNAAVLEMLIDQLDFSHLGKNLSEAIKLNELIAHSGVNTIDGRPFNESAYDPTDPLITLMGNVVTWSALTGKPVTFQKDYKDAKITASITPNAVLSLATTHTNLGTMGRTVQHGSLHLIDESLQTVSETDTPATLRELASYTLEVPEVIVDTALQEEIRKIASAQVDPLDFNIKARNVIGQYRESHNVAPDAVIDLGGLDVQHMAGGTLFYDFSSIRATVKANVSAAIFENCDNLYDCHVDGAGSAFSNCSVNRSSSNNTIASYERARAKDCIAMNGGRAFTGYDGTSDGCMAINLDKAFSGQKSVTNCYAKDCRTVFTELSGVVRDIVAEHCLFNFIRVTRDAKNCEIRNPKLFGVSWIDMPFIPGRPIRRNNKVVGRIVGKNFAKLRGQYRQKA